MHEHIFFPPQPVEHINKALYFGGVLQETNSWLRQAAQQLLPVLEQGVALFLPKNPFEKDEYYATHSLRMRWNQAYLSQASEQGMVALWIPKQSVFYPNSDGTVGESPRFAYNALVELQEAYSRHRHYGMPLVVGIDPHSPHFTAQEKRFKQFCPDVVVHDTLEDTCEHAVSVARKL